MDYSDRLKLGTRVASRALSMSVTFQDLCVYFISSPAERTERTRGSWRSNSIIVSPEIDSILEGLNQRQISRVHLHTVISSRQQDGDSRIPRRLKVTPRFVTCQRHLVRMTLSPKSPLESLCCCHLGPSVYQVDTQKVAKSVVDLVWIDK